MVKKIHQYRVSYMAHLFFIFTIPMILPLTGVAQPGMQDDIPIQLLKAYSSLIDFNIQKTQAQLDSFNAKGNTHPFKFYIASLEQSARLLSSGDKKDYANKKHLENEYLDEAQKLNDDNPYKFFLISEIKMQWALVKLNFGEEITAFWHLRQVYFLSEKMLKQHPDFLPLYKTHGFLHALFSGTPKKYQWIVRLFGIKPDMKEAIDLLTRGYKDINPVSPEVGILISLIHAYYYNNYKKAIPICDSLLIDHPNSSIIRLIYAFILIKNSNDVQAQKVLSGISQPHPGYLQIPAWYYLLGEIDIHKGNYPQAISQYRHFLSIQKGHEMIKDAHYKIAMCYWLTDRNILARKELEIAATRGETRSEMDIYADFMIRSGVLPNRQFLKIRYFTDGGYLHKADSVFNMVDTSRLTKKSDLVEYYYRKARLLDKCEQTNEAIEFYKHTISLQKDEPWYFGPNSCLQLGYIYMEKSPETASFYFEKVLRYDFDLYNHSIRQKAKLALEKMQ